MKSKSLACMCMAGVLAMCSITGCSKKGRSVEGASDDANKLVNVLEEPFNMNGFKVEFAIPKSDNSMKVSCLVDKNNNIQADITVDYKVMDYQIKGDFMTISLVGNDLYIDTTKGFELIKGIAGDISISEMEKNLFQNAPGITLESMLVSKIYLGDIDRSGITLASLKDTIIALDDVFALANSKSDVLGINDSTYSVRLDNANCSKYAEIFLEELKAKKDILFDNVMSFIDGTNLPENVKSIYSQLLSVARELCKKYFPDQNLEYLDELEGNVDKIETELKDQIEKLRSEKDSILERFDIKEYLKAFDSSEYNAEIEFEVNDTEKGYDVSLVEKLTVVSLDSDFQKEIKFSIEQCSDMVEAPETNDNSDSLMAVIAGVFVPQYFEYIEKSKRSADRTIAEELRELLLTMAADDVYSGLFTNGMTVYFDGKDISTDLNSDDEEKLKKAIYSFSGEHDGWKSNAFRGKTLEIKFEIDSDYNYKITTVDEALSNAGIDFYSSSNK